MLINIDKKLQTSSNLDVWCRTYVSDLLVVRVITHTHTVKVLMLPWVLTYLQLLEGILKSTLSLQLLHSPALLKTKLIILIFCASAGLSPETGLKNPPYSEIPTNFMCRWSDCSVCEINWQRLEGCSIKWKKSCTPGFLIVWRFSVLKYVSCLSLHRASVVHDFYRMRVFCAFLPATFSSLLPNRAHCEKLEFHCFLGKMPQASVQGKRGLGACRLKYLQWRHAMASFIRCLTSWTIKLSSMLNPSQILFFNANVRFSFFPWKGLCHCLKLLTLIHWFGLSMWFELKTSHLTV